MALLVPSANQKKMFTMHTIGFIVVNIILWFMWYKGSIGKAFYYPWPIWITSAWLLGLIGHWSATFRNHNDKGVAKFLEESKN